MHNEQIIYLLQSITELANENKELSEKIKKLSYVHEKRRECDILELRVFKKCVRCFTREFGNSSISMRNTGYGLQICSQCAQDYKEDLITFEYRFLTEKRRVDVS